MKSKNLIYTEDQEIAILPTEESLETICQNDSSKASIRGKKSFWVPALTRSLNGKTAISTKTLLLPIAVTSMEINRCGLPQKSNRDKGYIGFGVDGQ